MSIFLCRPSSLNTTGHFYILEPEGSSKEYRKNWARLIQKLYEIDPLVCPKCQRRMEIMAFIEEEKVIEKILEHLESWEMKARPPSRAKTPSLTTYLDASDSHLPRQHRGLVFAGPLILFGQKAWFEKAWKEIGNDGKDCQGLTVQIVNTLQKRRVDDFRKEASKETSDLLGVFGTLKT